MRTTKYVRTTGTHTWSTHQAQKSKKSSFRMCLMCATQWCHGELPCDSICPPKSQLSNAGFGLFISHVEMNITDFEKMSKMFKMRTFSHFAHQILWFVSAVCRLRATCVRILWTDSNSIECPEGFRSNYSSQGRTILRISQPFLALIWAKISYLRSSIFKIPHQLRDFCSN